MSYIKKARESKGWFIYLILFLVVIYVMQYYLFGLKFGQINHLYLLTGGFSFWLVLNIFGSGQFLRDHNRKTNWYKDVISFAGYFACFGSFLMATVLILPLENLPPEAIARVSFLFKIDIILLLYIFACIIFVWSKYVVKDETFVILDGKILYPGQKYEILPFLGYKVSVMKKSFPLSIDALELVCKNDRLRATISSSMAFDIEEAKSRKISAYDFSAFYIEAKECLGSLIQKRAELMNISEVINGNMEPEKLNIAGFPVIWDGNIQVLTL